MLTITFAFFQAAGLGRQEIAEFIVDAYPQSVSATDATGKTPLHYAALLKDDGKMTNFLIQAGADESVLDNVSFVTDQENTFYLLLRS